MGKVRDCWRDHGNRNSRSGWLRFLSDVTCRKLASYESTVRVTLRPLVLLGANSFCFLVIVGMYHMIISRDCSLNGWSLAKNGSAYLRTSRISTPHQQIIRSQNLVLCYVVIHSLAYKHHPFITVFNTRLHVSSYFLIALDSDSYAPWFIRLSVIWSVLVRAILSSEKLLRFHILSLVSSMSRDADFVSWFFSNSGYEE